MKAFPNLRTAALGAIAVAIAVAGATASDAVRASDHQESPESAADPAADLGDFYAWHTDRQTLVLVMTYAGYATISDPAQYDADVLYTFHVSNNGDAIAEHDIEVRFGQNAAGDWGLAAANIPGEREAITGAVETNLSGEGGAMVYAGLRDDPFFFDLDGFTMTLATGDLSFDASRDFASFLNTSAIVIEVPLAAVGGDPAELQLWATTARK